MQVALPLEKMSTEEKIQTMETIWTDLCKRVEKIPSPLWHNEILQKREEKISAGEDRFLDWGKTKKKILKKVL